MYLLQLLPLPSLVPAHVKLCSIMWDQVKIVL